MRLLLAATLSTCLCSVAHAEQLTPERVFADPGHFGPRGPGRADFV